MADDKIKYVYISENPSFVEKAGAIIGNTFPLSTTTVVVSGGIAPSTTLDAAAEAIRLRTRDSERTHPETLWSAPAYKWAYVAAFALTVLFALLAFITVNWGRDSEAARTLSTVFSHGAAAGLGAFLGLIGGKAANKQPQKKK